MTREEAKRRMEICRNFLANNYSDMGEPNFTAFDMAIQALSQEPTFDDECQKDMDEAWEQIQKKRKRIPVTLDLTPCDDAISREELLKAISTWDKFGVDDTNSLFRLDNLSLPHYVPYIHYDDVIKCIKGMPSVTQKSGKWIPVSERLPEDLEPVNITWVNHEPEPYYHDIKDRNFVATGIYYRGQWYWYSTTCADYLGEYGSNEIDKVDDAVEIIAWMPLPKPYESQESEVRNETDN